MEEMWYDKEQDILNIELNKGKYWKTIELGKGINIDLGKDGTIIGIEILRASSVFKEDIKKILEHVRPITA